MNLLLKLVGLMALAGFANSQAAMVSVSASADMSGGLPYTTSLLPIGTNVMSDVRFDIGAGTIDTSNITNVSGTFSWMDDSLGQQAFNANNVSISTTHSTGWFILDFTGNGPTIDSITADIFSIQFNIGTNPFLPPGSTTELFDLVLNSSIDRMRVGASQGGLTQFGDLQSNVTGSISAVPVPGALILFISGLLGLFTAMASYFNKL